MAERDQLARPLRGHDPRELRRRERVALRQLAQAARGLRRHPHLAARDGPAARHRLAADVDHPHAPALVDVRELAHERARRPAARGRSSVGRAGRPSQSRRGRAPARGRGSPSSRSRRSAAGSVSASWIASAWPSTSNGLTVTPSRRAPRTRPRSRDSTSTPSRSFTSGASFATRLSPSKIALTSRTSNCLYAATDAAKSSAIARSIGIQPSRPNRSFTRAGLALDRAEVLGVLGDVLPRRVEQREHADAPVQLGVRLQEQLERPQAADDVLRRVGAVDAQNEPLRPRATIRRSARAPRRSRELVELRRVDRDRMRGHEPSARRRRPPVLEVASAPTIPSHARRKFRRQRAGVEADDVVGEQAVVDRRARSAPAARASSRAAATGCATKCASARPAARSRTSRGARYRW